MEVVPTSEQTFVKPIIEDGADGATDLKTTKLLGALGTQPDDFTEMLELDTKLLLNVMVIIVSFIPALPGCEVMIAPAGAVHI